MFRRLTSIRTSVRFAHRMLKDPSTKYKRFEHIDIPDRKWPSRKITKAPRWLSTDLRDGNQSLPDPMSVEEKKEYFHKLVDIGFKEIEVSFPSASQTDFDFTRYAVENAPDDVAIQVLTQSREPLIRRTIESVRGAKHAIVHTYLATSDTFRDIVFNMSREEAVAKAADTARLIRSLTKDDPSMQDTKWTLQFSPECFSDTPTDFALEVCEAVKAVWEPTVEDPIIFNLPATVEVAGPNVYADQIEYFCRNISEREKVVVSVHCHNDRGCGVAATELGVLAGADRVEGCLFGNGERTGNVDLVTVALNLYTDGISPGLDFSDLESIIEVSERCNKIPTHPRAPYGGSLVVSAFSGLHQDAIKKGFTKMERSPRPEWTIPYLPLDPQDIGRSYEAVIRVNSQSGKGGAAWVILRSLGLDLPRQLQIVFSLVVQNKADSMGRELKADEITALFREEYFNSKYIQLGDYELSRQNREDKSIKLGLEIEGKSVQLSGSGNGPISAFLDAVSTELGTRFEVVNYNEHAIGKGTQSKAATFVELSFVDNNGKQVKEWGCGVNLDVSEASFEAILSVVNKRYADLK